MFNKFVWAGSETQSMAHLYDALAVPGRGSPLNPTNAESVKKFHVWKATTVALLLSSMNEERCRRTDDRLDDFKRFIFEDVDINLGIIQSGPREEYKQAFRDLLDEAVKLDKEISRQVACVVWTFETKVGTRAFDPVTMELEDEQLSSKGDQRVRFVIQPGVIKQGKSSGEEFDKIMWLLKMKVTCEAPMSN
jgi:hypothetical protein